jgi:hypothetical protein
MTKLPATGDRVTGTYHDVAFTGTVTSARWHSLNDSRLTSVELDRAIEVYGRERSCLMVTTDAEGGDFLPDPSNSSIAKA